MQKSAAILAIAIFLVVGILYWTGLLFPGDTYNMSPSDTKTVRKIIFQHFDYIVTEWNRFEELKNE